MTFKISCRADDFDKHTLDINYLLYHKGKLYSAGDDGKIKVWAQDLKHLCEVQAHPCSVYCLTASDEVLYSCSNDGTIKSWSLDKLEPKETLIKDENTEFWRVGFSDNCLFSGDNTGFIRVFKDNKMYGFLNIAEPVKDMAIDGTMVFTVKDLDLVVTDIKIDGEKLQYGTKNSFMGRAPVTIIGDKFCFTSREAKDIIIHENSDERAFRKVTDIPNAHDMVINAMAGATWDNTTFLYSAGWDKLLKKWIIQNGNVKPDGSCNMDIVVNAIAIGEKNEIYVGGSDGHIMRVQSD